MFIFYWSLWCSPCHFFVLCKSYNVVATLKCNPTCHPTRFHHHCCHFKKWTSSPQMFFFPWLFGLLKVKFCSCLPPCVLQACKNRIDVATLTLGLQPRQGLAKVWAKSELRSHISCSQECKGVWGNEPPHSQVNSHFGSWNPNRLLNL
jgi:hypothetical protein